MIVEETRGLLQVLADVIHQINAKLGYVRDTTLIDASRDARMEPLVVVSSDLHTSPVLTDLYLNVLDVISGFYLMAAQTNFEIAGVDVMKTLRRLNPDRRAWENSTPTTEFGIQPYELSHYTSEARDDKLYNDKESGNAAVGRELVIKIPLESGDFHEVSVIARLNIQSVTPDAATRLLTYNTVDDGVVERTHRLVAGSIDFAEWLLVSDMVDKKMQGMMDDVHNIQSGSNSRSRQGKIAGFKDGATHLNTVSAAYIISETVAAELEKTHRGSLEEVSTRDRIFAGIKAMMLVVVDSNSEMVVMYYKNIDYSTTLTFKSMKRKGKKDDTDILDLMKQLSSGNALVF